MPSSSDIQQTINSLVSSRNAWNQELLSYNSKLSVAKKLSEKNSLKKAIKNAEDQIKDLDRQMNKLQNDLKKATILESDKPTKLETIVGGITKIIDSEKLPSLNNLVDKTKGTGFQQEFNDEQVTQNEEQKKPTFTIAEDLKRKWITYGILAIVVLIFLFKRK